MIFGDDQKRTWGLGCDFCLWLFLDFSDYLFLAPRNLSCTGSKRELVAQAWELQIPKIISDEELQAKLREEYNNKLKKHDLKDPKIHHESTWKKDESQWPLVDLGKLFEYILDNREFGSDYIGKHETQNAFLFQMLVALKVLLIRDIMILFVCVEA